jgi:5S rRNA maturation endonuclease (ribonuclease M5)
MNPEIAWYLERLDDSRQTGHNRWMARCPAHPDLNPSLSLRLMKDGMALKCFAGCPYGAVMDALRSGTTVATGSPFRAGLTGSTGSKVPTEPLLLEAVYGYRDRHGVLLYEVLRYKPKTFRQRRPDGNDWWIWNLNGVTRVLYNLTSLFASPHKTVFFVEGEKDVKTLWEIGLLATTCGGSNSWRPKMAFDLADRDVILIPDNDEPGMDLMEKVAADLRGIADRVRILDIRGMVPAKGDVTDLINEKGRGCFYEIISTARDIT